MYLPTPRRFEAGKCRRLSHPVLHISRIPGCGAYLVLKGRNISSHDDLNAPHVAVVNREFARKILGSANNALGKHFKMPNGTHIEVVGIVEDGKYTANLAEDPQPAMFLPITAEPQE